MCDLHILPAFLCEYLRELVDVPQGVRPGPQKEPACASFPVFLSKISLHIQLPYILIIGKPLQDGEPGMVHPSLSPLCSLQDILLHQLRCHVTGLWSLSYRPHELLDVNLHAQCHDVILYNA